MRVSLLLQRQHWRVGTENLVKTSIQQLNGSPQVVTFPVPQNLGS